ncbi:MAG TPA: hypothetical protein P5294_06675 [Smithellaceae bacterium]|nr:hypothetical protein [Smithellaceae bacterium]HRS89388.1 hypothetical protein [Smithellaceae bacterium]HRV26202.1 hypothetical protein [Smithellaceae bacterium]
MKPKRSFNHWTPRYIKNRFAEICYLALHPDMPWLTPDANKILSLWLKKTDVGFEYGSGRSTLWFAKRVRHLISVEHNLFWFKKINKFLSEKNIDNVAYYYHPVVDTVSAKDRDYVNRIGIIKNESMDFVLIDGICRDFCARKAIDAVRPGGLLIIDDAHLYLPCKSFSPFSRGMMQGAASEVWEEVYRIISQWRCIWTSSGVKDTAFFIKP